MGKMKICLLVFSLFLLGKASAQDPHFSQFFSSPLTLNPAFTGKFFGTYRVAGNYRNQLADFNKMLLVLRTYSNWSKYISLVIEL